MCVANNNLYNTVVVLNKVSVDAAQQQSFNNIIVLQANYILDTLIIKREIINMHIPRSALCSFQSSLSLFSEAQNVME